MVVSDSEFSIEGIMTNTCDKDNWLKNCSPLKKEKEELNLGSWISAEQSSFFVLGV